jgi:hypothetical protein
MTPNMKINELKKRIVNLLELERVAAKKTLKTAQNNEDSDIVILSQSYIMGIERIQMLINNLIKEIKNE